MSENGPKLSPESDPQTRIEDLKRQVAASDLGEPNELLGEVVNVVCEFCAGCVDQFCTQMRVKTDPDAGPQEKLRAAWKVLGDELIPLLAKSLTPMCANCRLAAGGLAEALGAEIVGCIARGYEIRGEDAQVVLEGPDGKIALSVEPDPPKPRNSQNTQTSQ